MKFSSNARYVVAEKVAYAHGKYYVHAAGSGVVVAVLDELPARDGLIDGRDQANGDAVVINYRQQQIRIVGQPEAALAGQS